MSTSSGYVAIPRCPVIFDGANYADFAAFMRVHMRGLRLWGVLSGEVPCPPRPTAPTAPIPPTPVALALMPLHRPVLLRSLLPSLALSSSGIIGWVTFVAP
jgi:hypothetical protein